MSTEPDEAPIFGGRPLWSQEQIDGARALARRWANAHPGYAHAQIRFEDMPNAEIAALHPQASTMAIGKFAAVFQEAAMARLEEIRADRPDPEETTITNTEET